MPVEKEYSFETNDGTKTLAELFERHSQLIVRGLRRRPGRNAGCDSVTQAEWHRERYACPRPDRPQVRPAVPIAGGGGLTLIGRFPTLIRAGAREVTGTVEVTGQEAIQGVTTTPPTRSSSVTTASPHWPHSTTRSESGWILAPGQEHFSLSRRAAP